MKGNNPIPTDYTKKEIHKTPKVIFNTKQRAEKKLKKKQLKIKRNAPRPADGQIRPIVRCPTTRYNMKTRLGRGFTQAELAAAGIPAKKAMKFEIAIDRRRKNYSLETLEVNKERLAKYMARLVLLTPKEAKEIRDSKKVSDVVGEEAMDATAEPRKPTPEELEFQAYTTLKKLRGERHVERHAEELAAAEKW
ncbi:MAG: 60S ribosomal protein L13 [Amphiamblys sp. WSBS2006]|nr:MAG: 60S ribosomal protein L13 [Amphiamblys sp. WSBS2006]